MLSKKELLQLERDALIKWKKAGYELKKAMDYMSSEIDKEEVRNPLTGLYPVDDEFLEIAESYWVLYKKCKLAQERYFELAGVNDEL